jgi:DNA invertase Pin-like site-specific DNA recombinase
MSTDAQLLGDSLRRQVEYTKKFATECNLDLDTSFELRDIGMSAYDGSNIEKGHLGKFVAAVRLGQIEAGSYLIVESLDRLSRQKPRSALRLFLDLLDHGINIATLIDRRVYTSDSADQMDLMLSIALMSRAHDESLHKSRRLSAVWENKRRNATSRILTAKCKAWLKPKPDRTGFEIIPERVAIIARIFSEAADNGFGACAIAMRLNRDRVPTFGKSRGWHKSYILKMLTDRAVLGEFQPHVKAGVRTPVGCPLENYYPIVVERDVFHRVQAGLNSRRIRGGGRKGPRVSNLFSKLATCGLCGSRITFVNKGGRGGASMMCDAARRRMGCQPIGWGYEDFERSFLTFIREIDLATLVGDGARDVELKRFQREAAVMRGELDELKHRRERAFRLLIGDEPTEFLREKLRELDIGVDEKTRDLNEIVATVGKLSGRRAALETGFTQIGNLIDRVQSESSDDICRVRSSIASHLADIVSELILWPGGNPTSPEAEKEIRAIIAEKGRDPDLEIFQYITRLDKAHRAFFVRFGDGSYTFVAPHANDPNRLRSFSNREGLIGAQRLRQAATADHLSLVHEWSDRRLFARPFS